MACFRSRGSPRAYTDSGKLFFHALGLLACFSTRDMVRRLSTIVIAVSAGQEDDNNGN